MLCHYFICHPPQPPMQVLTPYTLLPIDTYEAVLDPWLRPSAAL